MQHIPYWSNRGYKYKWIPDESSAVCEQQVAEETVFTGFASPWIPQIRSSEQLLYIDQSLNKIIWFNPSTLTQGGVPAVNAGGWTIPAASGYSASYPTGFYYNPVTDVAYVQGNYTNGVYAVRMSDMQILNFIQYGSVGLFSKGSINIVQGLNQVWANGGSGESVRIDLNTHQQTSAGPVLLNNPGVQQFVGTAYNKLYVFRDFNANSVDVYSLATNQFLYTINNLASNTNPGNGGYTLRGFFKEDTQRFIFGEVSSTPTVHILDTESDTMFPPVVLFKEGYAYGSVGIVNNNTLTNQIYVGGSLFNQPNASDAVPRIWIIDRTTVTVVATIQLSANKNVDSMIYFPYNRGFYIGSRGAVPDVPGHDSDGAIFKFT